jgi:hypothetical protein
VHSALKFDDFDEVRVSTQSGGEDGEYCSEESQGNDARMTMENDGVRGGANVETEAEYEGGVIGNETAIKHAVETQHLQDSG